MKYIFLILIIAVQLLSCQKEDETLTGAIIGKVTMNGVDGLSGVKAEIESQNIKKETFTDSEGMFSFDDLGRDYYTVTASMEGYHTRQTEVVIMGNGKPDILEIELFTE